jgi:hypothetical protein
MPLWRVVLSHATYLRYYPTGRSYVDAAQEAVTRAGHAVRDMKFLVAADCDPAEQCKAMVEDADVYTGIIGSHFGSMVPGRDLSYTELEFETATHLRLPRLMFLLPMSGPLRIPIRQPAEHTARQQAFRRRVQDESGVMTAHVETPAELELKIFQALVELSRRGPRRSA